MGSCEKWCKDSVLLGQLRDIVFDYTSNHKSNFCRTELQLQRIQRYLLTSRIWFASRAAPRYIASEVLKVHAMDDVFENKSLANWIKRRTWSQVKGLPPCKHIYPFMVAHKVMTRNSHLQMENRTSQMHSGTTEEGNCSYLLPRAAAAGSKRHKYGPKRKVPVHEITWFLVYRMGVTRSQLGANNGILVCLVREIWQFKLFAGKEVTAVPDDPRGKEVTDGEEKGYCACVETESLCLF